MATPEVVTVMVDKSTMESNPQDCAAVVWPVQDEAGMGLQGENGFPHQGLVNFVNNKVDPSTGTIMVRGVFDNPKPEHGVRVLSPGMFVRVRLPIGVAHPALLVADEAINTDQGQKFLYLVDTQKKVEYREVKLGPDGEVLVRGPMISGATWSGGKTRSRCAVTGWHTA